jgi:hypothetical protein
MTREEAQNILQLCRPGSIEDRNDPLLAEAFTEVENDPELAAWFVADQAFDEKFAAELATITPPEALKSSLLAGMRAHQLKALQTQTEHLAQSSPAPTTAVPTTAPAWWRKPWIGIAALFIVMIGVTLSPDQSVKTDTLAQAAPQQQIPGVLKFLSDQIDGLQLDSFDKRDAQFTNLQTFLASSGSPTPETLPQFFDQMQTIGCVTFDYNQTKLSMICFNSESVYHLITAFKTNFPDVLPNQAQNYQFKDKAFKIWTEGELVRIITVQGTEKDIPEFI